MRECKIYACESCDYKCEDAKEMEKHEAAHLGLTVKDARRYKKLKELVRYAGAVVARTKNEEAENNFDKAIQSLIDFEKFHKITNS